MMTYLVIGAVIGPILFRRERARLILSRDEYHNGELEFVEGSLLGRLLLIAGFAMAWPWALWIEVDLWRQGVTIKPKRKSL